MSERLVETYPSVYDNSGNRIKNLFFLVVPIKYLREDGEILGYSIGTNIDSNKESICLIVDHNIREQMESLKITYVDGIPRLSVKEGCTFKTLEEQETPEEREIRLLEEKLAALRAARGQ